QASGIFPGKRERRVSGLKQSPPPKKEKGILIGGEYERESKNRAKLSDSSEKLLGKRPGETLIGLSIKGSKIYCNSGARICQGIYPPALCVATFVNIQPGRQDAGCGKCLGFCEVKT
ncbi:MAG: hypothetical protein LBG07_05810, partial [Treponema sp.]|nr:hypothetical protein [Treponema sp.]